MFYRKTHTKMEFEMVTTRLLEDHYPPVIEKEVGLFKSMYSRSMYMLSLMNNLSLQVVVAVVEKPSHQFHHIEKSFQSRKQKRRRPSLLL